MANKLMTKSEANDYCLQNGYKLFIDLCIREKVIIEPDPPKIIKLFEYEGSFGGTIRLETWPEGLVLWVNGKIKYKYWEDTDNQK